MFRTLLCCLLSTAPVFAGEIEIQATGEFGTLAGTYLDVGSNTPPILIIPGSGPIDRNGLRAGVPGIGAYERLALALETRGISTVRIDKRGTFKSNTAIRDTDDLRIQGYANDTLGWIDAVKDISGQPCIWVFGHSEGGLVASLAIAQNPDGVCGLILAAAPGRHIDEILREQLARHTKSNRVRAMIDDTLAKLKTGQSVDPKELPLILKILFNPVNQRYFMDWMTYDPATVVENITVPVLIVQGDEDVQIAVEDAQRLSAALPQADLHVIKGMNHSFLASDLTFPPKGTPLSAELFDVIQGFLARTAPQK